MDSRELVRKTLRGANPGRTPLHGWVDRNLEKGLTAAFGSPANFEDKYSFDLAFVFGIPECYDMDYIEELKKPEGSLTPDILLSIPLRPTDNIAEYVGIINGLEFHQKSRGRFCYVQTNGIFELHSGIFGIEDHLCWVALYPGRLRELYARQAEWNRRVAGNCLDLGADMVNVADDCGTQRGMMFSPAFWRSHIYPNHKIVVDHVKKRGGYICLHSDGNVLAAMDWIAELGYDVFHPWQETAGMGYDVYLNRYSDKIGLMGGLCVQSTLGFGDYPRLESEIRRIFGLLKGKRWIFGTTHYVQEHCTMEELVFAYDLVVRLARS